MVKMAAVLSALINLDNFLFGNNNSKLRINGQESDEDLDASFGRFHNWNLKLPLFPQMPKLSGPTVASDKFSPDKNVPEQ